MGDDLDLLKQQNKNLKAQLSALRQKHEYTVLQLTDARENEQKLKKLNDSLIKSLESTTFNFEPLKDINLVLDGQFSSNKIAQLQQQLDRYRSGVNDSVDRRVRQIIREYSSMQQDNRDRRNSQAQSNNVNINYNVMQKKKSGAQQCQTCIYLKGLLQEKQKLIAELNIEIEQLRADSSIYAAKLGKMQALTDTLKKQNQLLQNQLRRLQYQISKQKQSGYSQRTYSDQRQDRSIPYITMTRERRQPSSCKDQEYMMRQITNIAQTMNSRKIYEDKSKSRIVPSRDGNALFSIKNGINRPTPLYL